MPIISSFYGIIIRMYFGDHVPPHFHAQYGEHNAIISIIDFGIIEGYLPPKANALIVEWAVIHKDDLLYNWKNLSELETGTFKKIEPLS